MMYLALGCAALALFLFAGGRRFAFKRREWRFLSASLALIAFTTAAWTGIRGMWGATLALLVLGLWLSLSTRRAGAPSAAQPAAPRMSAEDARRILGVEPGATRQEIQAAYTRLMRMAHPDHGGTAGLAAQLNAARDCLLKS